jgi:hypothetical protein
MDRFTRRVNVERYVRLLATVTDETQRKQLEALLAEERRKQKEAGDPERR